MQINVFSIFVLLLTVCLPSEAAVCNFLVANARLLGTQEVLVARAASFKADQETFLHSADQKRHAAEVFQQLLIGGHDIVEGDGWLIGIWSLSKDSTVVDSGKFSRLSIEIPTVVQGQTYPFGGTTKNRAYFSEGALAWVAKGNGFYSRTPVGQITVLEVNDETVVVQVNAKIDAIDLSPFDTSDSRSVYVNEKYSLHRVPLNDVDFRVECK